MRMRDYLLGMSVGCCFAFLVLEHRHIQRRVEKLATQLEQQQQQQQQQRQQQWPSRQYNYVDERGIEIERLVFDAEQYSMALVSDLDEGSVHPNKSFTWYSILQRAELLRDPASELWDVSWGAATTLETQTANRNRSMELSELVQYRGRLLGMCDRTGILYKVDLTTGAAWPRWAIADGDGNEPQPFKGEWATVKEDKLWVGSPGVKWRDIATGKMVHRNPEWVKHMDERGHIVNHDWGPVYAALRKALGVTSNGYVWHEAVHWDALNRLWVFLPRRISRDGAPSAEADETRGANWLLLADENFENITARRLGPLEPEWGFTSVRKVLGTVDAYVALKVKEVRGHPMQTKLCVFDLHGRFLLDPDGTAAAAIPVNSPWDSSSNDAAVGVAEPSGISAEEHRRQQYWPFVNVPGEDVKFEGVEFLGIPSMYRYLTGHGSDPFVSKEECKRSMRERMATATTASSTSLLAPASQEMSASLIDS